MSKTCRYKEKHYRESSKYLFSILLILNMLNDFIFQTHATLENDSTRAKSVDQNVTLETPRSLLNDVSITQEKILDIAKTIAEEGRSVDHIIYDAK